MPGRVYLLERAATKDLDTYETSSLSGRRRMVLTCRLRARKYSALMTLAGAVLVQG